MTARTATPSERASRLTFRPNCDVSDRGDEVVFVADMPGARADTIDVTFDDGVLTLHAAVAPRDLPGRAVRQEYGIGDYRRAFRLGEGFDGARIAADYARGVLTVRVPRLAAVLPRRVEVRAG
ncbi:MAG: Hsp20/alpha crystallin family protein [Planctomycetaceae bacterium]